MMERVTASKNDITRSTDAWIAEVQAALAPVADPAKARVMQAYMKDIAPFLGIATPIRRWVVKSLGFPKPDQIADVCRALFALPEREYAYVACDWMERATRRGSPALLDVIEELARVRPWWDVIDALAKSVGNLVRRHPHLVATLDQWINDESFWVARLAILHQLHSGDDTNVERLHRYCLARSGDTEFFIRKAIGWALRERAWHAPDEVEAFFAAHPNTFNALTIREATKNLDQARGRRQARNAST
jgi:3-methyladenine DNA glycosylase AlkD